jgi:hypothetical protein
LEKNAVLSSPPLADLQQWLRWIITHPQGISNALAGVDSSPSLPDQRFVEPKPRRLDEITQAPPFLREQRLGVYSNAYFARLLESLESDFPAVRRVLGQDPFRRLAADYLLKHPSSSPHVGDLGAALPQFALSHPFAIEWPFLPDLINLEWAILLSLWSERLPPLDPSLLQSVPEQDWPTAQLILDPTVRLLATAWSVDRLWEKRMRPETKKKHRLLKQSPRWLLLYRDDHWVQLRALEEPQWFLLQSIQRGKTLEVACDQLTQRYPTPGSSWPVMQWFTQWVQSGVIKNIAFQGADTAMAAHPERA